MAYYCISYLAKNGRGSPSHKGWGAEKVFYKEEEAQKFCLNRFNNVSPGITVIETEGAPEDSEDIPYVCDLQYHIVLQPPDDDIERLFRYYSYGYFYSDTTIDEQSFVILHEYDHKEGGVSCAIIEYEPNKEELESIAELLGDMPYFEGGDVSEFSLNLNRRISFHTAFEMTWTEPFGYSYYGVTLYTGRGHWEPIQKYLGSVLHKKAVLSTKILREELQKIDIPSGLIDICEKEILKKTWKNEDEYYNFIQTVFYKDGIKEFFFPKQSDETTRIEWFEKVMREHQ